MERCKECKLAVYCFSDSSSWIFRTTQEMGEKRKAIADCPVHDQMEQARVSQIGKKLNKTDRKID